MQTTEDELTAESDDATATPTKTPISFNEFLQQYKELTDWLNQVVGVTSKESQTLSEKYLNQVRELHPPSQSLCLQLSKF